VASRKKDKETAVPILWEVAMANARSKAKRKPPPANRKFPGVDVLTKLLETMNSAEIATELNVTRHTVTNWISRSGLKDKAVKIKYEREARKAAREQAKIVATAEHLGKIEGGAAAFYARMRISAAEGINGWRYTRQWLASEA